MNGRPFKTRGKWGAILALALLGCSAACVEETEPPDPNALSSFRVTLVDTSALGEAPFEFPAVYTPVTIAVDALRGDGTFKDDYQGTVQVQIVPGELDPATRFLRLERGINAGHTIRFRYAFGETRIWVEEVGLAQANECVDGFDNDGNGRLDFPGDPGCFGPDDPSEGTATYVTAITDPLDFQPISIRSIQLNPEDPDGESPIVGEEVKIETGALVVTNIVSNGFYFSDLDEERGYNSIFVFNFSFPDGVRVGDKLLWVSGGVAEFLQDTQLTFPTWEHDTDYQLSDDARARMALCQPAADPSVLEVVPVVLSGDDFADHEILEAVESSVVRIENARISDTFMNCDFDFNGDIEGVGEEACRSECQVDNLCTELSSFNEFDQINVEVDGASAQIARVKQIANFDPTEACEQVSETGEPLVLECPERTLASATGNVRHIWLTPSVQLYELVPRFFCDFRFACSTSLDCPSDGECIESLCEYQ